MVNLRFWPVATETRRIPTSALSEVRPETARSEPSRLQARPEPAASVNALSSPPSTGARYTMPLRMKATRLPSGDHSGKSSRAGPSVRRRGGPLSRLWM